MKKQLPLGLIAEGNLTSSSILRLPSVVRELGPVKSRGLRLARRASNYLQAGWAVDTYEELQDTRLIFIHVPDWAATRVVSELCASELEMSSLTFAFGETWMSASVLDPLRDRGAGTVTIIGAASSRRNWFILEGGMTAVRALRRVIELNDARALQIQSGRKPLYFAAELLATTLPTALFAHAEQALRTAGISGNLLHTMLEDMSHEMFRTFANRGRITWGGPVTKCSDEVAQRHFESLRAHDSAIADYIEGQLAVARSTLALDGRRRGPSAKLK